MGKTNEISNDASKIMGCFIAASFVAMIAAAIAAGLIVGAWLSFIIVSAYFALWMIFFALGFAKEVKHLKKREEAAGE